MSRAHGAQELPSVGKILGAVPDNTLNVLSDAVCERVDSAAQTKQHKLIKHHFNKTLNCF
jgi:hypothetical protein